MMENRGHEFEELEDGTIETEFMIVDQRIVRSKRLTPNEKNIYMVIKSFAYGKKTTSFPSRETIAEFCNLSVRTVTDGIKELESIGILQVLDRRNQNLSNLYKIVRLTDELIELLATPKKTEAKKPKAKKDEKPKEQGELLTELIAKMGQEKYPFSKKAIELLKTLPIEVIETLHKTASNKIDIEGTTGKSLAKVISVYINKMNRIPSKEDVAFLHELLQGNQPSFIRDAFKQIKKIEDLLAIKEEVIQLVQAEKQKVEDKWNKPKGNAFNKPVATPQTNQKQFKRF